MTYTITRNEAFNSLEITFDGKPSEEIRAALKALRFRWHGVKKLWYGYADEEAVTAILTAGNPAQPPKAQRKPARAAEKPAEAEAQNHIRIYWNGIKIDGGKLIRCFYSLNNDCTIKGDCVSISARDYADLPRDLLPVRNDTDTYTDYFDSDRATLTPDHPLYKYFRFAAMKARARDDSKYCEHLREDLNSGRREPWPGHFDTLRADLERREKFLADYANESDPGQPTAADLATIDKRRQEAENARRAAEHEAELQERERLLNLRNDGRRLIEATAEAHPIEDAAPVVTINWSEHPAFYAWADDALKLSVPAADHILFALDLKQHNTRGTEAEAGWYYKTKFTITGTDPDGDPINYSGRFDIGDGEGGLINHIRNFGEWYRLHDDFGHEKPEPEATNDVIQFADYLQTFTA